MAGRDPDTEWLRVAIFRRMTGGQKVEMASRMYEDALAAVRASIRYWRPNAYVNSRT